CARWNYSNSYAMDYW
nr:immunoglobulin heavy chain junction region [Mus musculus]